MTDDQRDKVVAEINEVKAELKKMLYSKENPVEVSL